MAASNHTATKLPDGVNGTRELKSPQDPESSGASNCATGPDSPEVPELQELRTREAVDDDEDEEEEEEAVSRERSPVSKGPKHKAKKEVSKLDGKEHKNHNSRASSPNYTGMTLTFP